ncbi:family 15 glycosyltransferase [Phycomyces nitens]|nr:family 15 glycosyltransferase [Phycomyces nitens]
MMSKRRQTVGIQIAAALAVLFIFAMFYLPEGQDPSSVFKPLMSGTEEAQLIPGGVDLLDQTIGDQHSAVKYDRANAVFVVLARNRELNGIRKSMRQMEDRFNRKFNYPYVFLNDEEFSEEFIALTTSLTKGQTFYGKIDESMWGYPSHINQTYAAECRKDLEAHKVIYGGSESYRHMCRFQSGFFFRHPLLETFEYYWRLEPDIEYYCDVNYDVFKVMRDNDFKYGWTISLTEYMATIPTLWETTKKFISAHPEYMETGPESLREWITDDNFKTYNGCHFWSNFEVGSLNFLRSERYIKFFEHLDNAGGFFYERWGDAPVHSLAVALMLKKSEVHFFNDIGYKHNPLMHCPIEGYLQKQCHCNKQDNFDWTSWSCATRYKKIQPDFIWNEHTFRNKTNAYIPAPGTII